MAAIPSLSSPNLVQKSSSAAVIRKISSLRISPFAGSGLYPGSSLPFLGQRSGGRLRVSALAAVAEGSSDVARRLYVGNIPRNVNNDELSSIFSEHGSVDTAEVMYDKYSGRSRRFAFVTMGSVEDANVAVEKLDGSEIGGRKIKVNVTEKPLQSLDLPILQSDESKFIDSPFKVYVGNLAKSVTSDVLTKFFSERGKVVSAKVSRTPGASKSSGFGFVTFSSEEDVDAAILSANNAFLEGQRIRVNKA